MLSNALQVQHLQAMLAQREAQASKDALPAPEGWHDAKELHTALEQARAAADAASQRAKVRLRAALSTLTPGGHYARTRCLCCESPCRPDAHAYRMLHVVNTSCGTFTS